MTTETIPERVARGAAWLDRVRPGWRDTVTPSALVMHDGCKCICGQVFAEASHPLSDGFLYAQEKYADNRDWDTRHGFNIVLRPFGRMERWADLEAEWYRVLGVPTTERPLRHCAHV